MFLEVVAKFWLNWILGILAAGLAGLCKHFYSLYKKEKKHQKTEEQKEFYKGLQTLIEDASQMSRKEEQRLQGEIDIIKNGILSLQGRSFKQECRGFLRPEREFTLEEFEALQNEHDIYNQLGGNHDGDTLFNLVSKKAGTILTDDK